MPYRRSYSGRGSYRAPSRRKAPARRKATRRAPQPQIVKVVIEHTGQGVARPEAAGLVATRDKKAKF